MSGEWKESTVCSAFPVRLTPQSNQVIGVGKFFSFRHSSEWAQKDDRMLPCVVSGELADLAEIVIGS